MSAGKEGGGVVTALSVDASLFWEAHRRGEETNLRKRRKNLEKGGKKKRSIRGGALHPKRGHRLTIFVKSGGQEGHMNEKILTAGGNTSAEDRAHPECGTET